jgi:hypothetical protein
LEGVLVTAGKTPQADPKADAAAVEAKFGDFADVYAEARSEAAQMTGNEPGEDHWKEVADTVDGEDDR